MRQFVPLQKPLHAIIMGERQALRERECESDETLVGTVGGSVPDTEDFRAAAVQALLCGYGISAGV